MWKWAFAILLGVFISTLLLVSNSDSEIPASAVIREIPSDISGLGLTPDEINNMEVFSSVSPSVVHVTNQQVVRRRFSRNVMEIPRGSATGFVWDDSGLIVTNYHVIHGASKVTITLQSGESYDAELVGYAREKDIALLRIAAPDLTPVTLGDSSGLVVGRKVLAIGNPFELDTTLTVGVVSALGREIKSLANRTIKNVIQTDAAINPGNSGGPLLNSYGQLVGVNTSIISPSGGSAGIGFAIPINTVKKIVPQLLEYGRLFRPVLGIEPLSDNIAQTKFRVKGVAIFRVQDGLPAKKAGMVGIREDYQRNLYLGDVIIALDDEPVINEDTLLSLLEQHKPGDTVKVTTLRDDEIVHYEITLAEPGQ